MFSLPVAMSHLNGQKVFGKVMRVTLSKHQTVALPREGLDDQLLTKGKMIHIVMICISLLFNKYYEYNLCSLASSLPQTVR